MKNGDFYGICTRLSRSLAPTYSFASQLVDFLGKMSAIWSDLNSDATVDLPDVDSKGVDE